MTSDNEQAPDPYKKLRKEQEDRKKAWAKRKPANQTFRTLENNAESIGLTPEDVAQLRVCLNCPHEYEQQADLLSVCLVCGWVKTGH